jgi:hypothetical protein
MIHLATFVTISPVSVRFGVQLLAMLLSVSMDTIRIRVGCVVLVPAMAEYSNHCIRTKVYMRWGIIHLASPISKMA